MADKVKAARQGDPIIHTSMWAEVLSQLTQAAVVGLAVVVVVAALPCEIITAVGATAASLAAGATIAVASNKVEVNDESLSDHLSDIGDDFANWAIPPSVAGFIAEGSADTRINGLPAARAAGYYSHPDAIADPVEEPNALVSAGLFLAGLLPVVGGLMEFSDIMGAAPIERSADPGTEPANHDTVQCDNHSPSSGASLTPLNIFFEIQKQTEYIAEGSKEVFINSQPAARGGERTTCDATINDEATAANVNISTDVRIGGESVVVRDIHSGKSKLGQLVGLVVGIVLGRRRGKNQRCVGHPVMIGSGAKVLGGEEDLDFSLAGQIPIIWQRTYDSSQVAIKGANQEKSLFGEGWSTAYEVAIERVAHPQGGELSVYINEEGERVELGRLKQGGHFVSKLDGILFYQIDPQTTLTEDLNSGRYQLFELDPTNRNRSRLTAMGDRNQNTIQLHYDPEGRLSSLSDKQSGEAIRLSYGRVFPRRVSRIERVYRQKEERVTREQGSREQFSQTGYHHDDNNNNNNNNKEQKELLVSYSYNEQGLLSEVRNPLGEVLRSYCYNQQKLMESHRLAEGNHCYYQWQCFKKPATGTKAETIDGIANPLPPRLEGEGEEEWRVIRHWTESGESYEFHYDLAKGETTVSDSIGRKEHYRWDGLYDIIQHTDAEGHISRYTLVEGLLIRETDTEGNEWQYSYDELGRLIETRDPMGRTERVKLLKQWSLPSEHLDRASGKTTYRYDQRGNVIAITDPAGRQSQYHYDSRGQLKCITDPVGGNSYYYYNDRGQLTRHRDCSGAESHYHYDQQGKLSETIDADLRTTRYRYDRRGHLTEIELDDGRKERYEYHLSGQLLSYTDPMGGRTEYQYDLAGRIKQRKDVQGRKVEFSHDPYGRLEKLTNENGESYRFEWDGLNRLRKQEELDGSSKHYYYNSLGGLTGIDHQPSTQGESKLNNGVANKTATDITTKITTKSKKEATATDRLLRQRFERDSLGRLIKKITEESETEYQYNERDQLTKIIQTDQQGQQETLEFRYNPAGLLIEEISDQGSLKYDYDELGNLSQLTLDDGRQLKQLYYGSGHLLQINLEGRIISDFERDSLHREVLRSQGKLKTQTCYDSTHRLREKRINYQDASAATSPLLRKSYRYDGNNNLVCRQLIQTQREKSDRNRRKHAYEPVNQSQNEPSLGWFYAAGSADEEKQRRQMLGHYNFGHKVSEERYYYYDGTGRIKQSYRHTGKEQYSQREQLDYDAAANLLDCYAGQGYVKYNRVHVYQDNCYDYDGYGRLIEKWIGNHTRQTFSYDAEQRIKEIRVTRGTGTQHICFRYDPLGRRTEKTVYDATDLTRPIRQTQFCWQGMRLLSEKQLYGIKSLYIYADQNSYEPLARVDGEGEFQQTYYFHTDQVGLPEQMTDSHGKSVWKAEYRLWGTTKEELHDDRLRTKQNLRYQGQYLDRETGLHYNLFRYYDPDIGRFTQPDPIGLLGGINLYQYAPNALGWADPWGLSCTPKNKKTSYQGISRRDAFRQAKRDAGIPMNQQPYEISRAKLGDGHGDFVRDKNGIPVQTRQYHFKDGNDSSVVIQEHSLGHAKAVTLHGAEPHFNVRPAKNLNTGDIAGTHGHYNF